MKDQYFKRKKKPPEVEKFGKDWPEYKFYKAIEFILQDAEYPQTEEAGLGLLYVLENIDFVIGEFNTLTHPVTSSIYMHIDIVAALFPEVKTDSDWWHAVFQVTERKDFSQEWIDYFLEVFRKHPDVTDFFDDYLY